MKKSTENNSEKNFLKEGLQSDISKHHKEYLGTGIPDEYFSKSKTSILNKIKLESNQTNFLQEDFSDINEHHKKYLGTNVPEGYFEKSKLSILDKIKEKQIAEVIEAPKKGKVFWLQPQFRYIAAASVVFILSLTIWLQNTNDTLVEEDTIELLSFNDDVLINSLFVEDEELEAYTNTTLMNEVVIKAELSEQIMDDFILDSMILEDSLSDDKFIETLIL